MKTIPGDSRGGNGNDQPSKNTDSISEKTSLTSGPMIPHILYELEKQRRENSTLKTIKS